MGAWMHTNVNRGLLGVWMGLYEVWSGLYAIYSVFEARTFSRASLQDGYWMYTDPPGGQTGPSAVNHCSPSIV